MNQYDVIIIGAGFTGLTAGLELTRLGKKVLILEKDSVPGGLASTFEFRDGARVEKFYHHWFTSDRYITDLVKTLGMESEVVTMPSRVGMYFNGQFWKLSTPMDLLRFSPLSFVDRIRLGLLVFQVRRIKDWKSIEHLSIREWLESLCGKNVYRVVWEPLVKSKFSIYAEDVNAVWFWKKLVLRGSTRNNKGGEQLSYFKGGFGRLAEAMAEAIVKGGGDVRYNTPVNELLYDGNELTGAISENTKFYAKMFLFTPAFPLIADFFEKIAPPAWIQTLRRVKYLGNMCLVLELDRSLSDTYWLNVNDPGFPFVGVIEHTNFDAPENYKGSHITFLSRYLAVSDPVWVYTDQQYLDFALQHLKRMFPKMEASWVKDFRVWRSEYAQPVTERAYSEYVPGQFTPFNNAYISTMAQIYPEDRGTNYAVREGKQIAEVLSSAEDLLNG
ncbi:MAG: NAD(P)/FAD-dependent oxidoreductase [Gammaproteobacteria bacterium]